jgi:hypothetical protein
MTYLNWGFFPSLKGTVAKFDDFLNLRNSPNCFQLFAIDGVVNLPRSAANPFHDLLRGVDRPAVLHQPPNKRRPNPFGRGVDRCEMAQTRAAAPAA